SYSNGRAGPPQVLQRLECEEMQAVQALNLLRSPLQRLRLAQPHGLITLALLRPSGGDTSVSRPSAQSRFPPPEQHLPLSQLVHQLLLHRVAWPPGFRQLGTDCQETCPLPGAAVLDGAGCPMPAADLVAGGLLDLLPATKGKALVLPG